MPQEYDDPNSTLAAIIECLKKLSINVDFPPTRLKSGYGEHVCYVISELTTIALKKVNFSFKRPEIPKIKPQDDELVDEDDAEVQINNV
ncbi:hypothetical protein, partial [Salmonella sp. s51228]|uniref:hypothetical protein n=1 Tax=Salmonella sp. s51228 TaxID=3159652 RepID=UPI00397F616C